MRKPEGDGDTLMSDVTGTRALWWLYKHGMWGYLEDFGLRREDAEPAFVKFDQEHVVKHRLNKDQARKLARLIPGLKEASVELRLTYALKAYDEEFKQASALERSVNPGKKRPIKRKKPVKIKKEKKMTAYYHAEVPTFEEAEQIAKEHADFIVNQAGGTIDVGRTFGTDTATLIVSMPDGANPDEVLPGRLAWQEMAFFAAQAVPDMNVPSDEPEN